MSAKNLRPLDPESLALFERKGREDLGAEELRAAPNANAVKVRRVMQLTCDLATKPLTDLRILDLACGEGVYAIEAALGGAKVLGIDARPERMGQGAAAAGRLGLSNLRFEQGDVRRITLSSHGTFDIIFFLGILYHLDAPDSFLVVENLHEMCGQCLIIDTHISLLADCSLEHRGRRYEGARVREHDDADTEETRQKRLLASLDNTFSFYFTRASLVRLLRDTGFTTVLECEVPLEPSKPEDRITVAALTRKPVEISTYPWINGRTEEEIEMVLPPPPGKSAGRPRMRQRIATCLRRIFRF